MSEPLLTTQEICRIMKCTDLTIFAAIKKGLPCYRIARSYRFNEQEVLTWFAANVKREPAKPRKPKAVLTRVNEPAKISPPEPLPLPIVDTPPLPLERTENAPKAERAINALPLTAKPEPAKDKATARLELAASLNPKAINDLARKTAGKPESIHTRHNLKRLCPLYLQNKACCTDKRTAGNCCLIAYEQALKACEAARTA